MTTSMRLILIIINLTLLAQPVWAMRAEKLIELCTQCKETGFAEGLPINDDGMRTYGCAARS